MSEDTFSDLYAKVVDAYQVRQCFTVSPDMRMYSSYDDVVDVWHRHFYKMRRHINGGLFVLELAGIRPHFHCVIDVSDKIGVTKTLFSWAKYHNVRKHNMFKDGIKYLFKEYDNTKDCTGIEPLYTYEDIIKEETRREIERIAQKRQRKLELHEDVNKDIPLWMRGDNNCNESL